MAARWIETYPRTCSPSKVDALVLFCKDGTPGLEVSSESECGVVDVDAETVDVVAAEGEGKDEAVKLVDHRDW